MIKRIKRAIQRFIIRTVVDDISSAGTIRETIYRDEHVRQA